MFPNPAYERVTAECNSLRRQLTDAYHKCSTIYDSLAFLDEHWTKERTVLQGLVTDLQQSIEKELEKNQHLSSEKLQLERQEKHLQEELTMKTHDLNHVFNRYRKLHLVQAQERFIRENLVVRVRANAKK